MYNIKLYESIRTCPQLQVRLQNDNLVEQGCVFPFT